MKIFILELTNLSRDAMHVHVGMAIFILIWMLWRWRGGRAIAWLFALAAALGGEYLDHSAYVGAVPDYVWQEHWRDIFSTMLWPTLLAIFVGLLPYVSHQKREAREALARDKADLSDE